jgi:hypothetical protein
MMMMLKILTIDTHYVIQKIVVESIFGCNKSDHQDSRKKNKPEVISTRHISFCIVRQPV